MNANNTKLFTLATMLFSLSVLLGAARFTSTPTVPATNHLLVAQAFLDDRCPEEYVFLQGDTRNHKVVICGERGTGNPTHYLGILRINGSSILLPLNAYTETRFFARNGRYTYTLDLRSQTLTMGVPGRRPRVERFTVELP